MRKLTLEEVNKVEQARGLKSGNFGDLVRILGLRPELDFRFADLAEVDFGAADLKSYDFTGADLRGSDFSEAKWKDACFLGARVDKNTRWGRSPPYIQPLGVGPATALLRSEMGPLVESILPRLNAADRNALLLLVQRMAPTGIIHLELFERLAFPNATIPNPIDSFYYFQRTLREVASVAEVPFRLVVDERGVEKVGWFGLDPAWKDILHGCAFSLSGNDLYAVGKRGMILRWDWQARKLAGVATEDTEILACSVSPDGGRLATASDDRTLSLLDIKDRVPDENFYLINRDSVRYSAHLDYVRACAFSPDGKRIVSTSGDRTVRVIDFGSKKTIFKLAHLSDAGEGCAFSPDGSLVASASRDGTIGIWDSTNGDLVRQIEASAQCVTSCGFSSDSALLASTSHDSTVRVWRVATGAPYRVLEGHKSRTTACLFSPDERHLASASDDGTVRIWDIKTGECVNVLQGNSSDTGTADSAGVVSCAYSRDGRHLGTTSGNNCLRVWDALTGICLSESFAED